MAQSVGKDYTGEIEKLSRKKAATASRVADLDRERGEAKQMLDNLEANRKAAVFGALDSIKKRYFGRLLGDRGIKVKPRRSAASWRRPSGRSRRSRRSSRRT